MLKYTIYEQRSQGHRNVIGTLTTVRGIPLNELRPALSQLAKGERFYFHNDRTNLDVKNESLAIDRIFKNKALVIRFPQRANSPTNNVSNHVPVPAASTPTANVAESDEQREPSDGSPSEIEPMDADEELDSSEEPAKPPRRQDDSSEHPRNPPSSDIVSAELHEAGLTSTQFDESNLPERDEQAEKEEQDETISPVPESPPSPSAGKTSSNNSGDASTHSAERGPSSTRSGGSYGE
ncbi:hypothetical protein BIW11_02862 [Tropilaelaps mercedesae]|uniref:Uncharacterized protein n=1 Tax=Tropilaelaps mercedesae TaxID=418985 RepID=A0A1V9XW58_9ACAR|nr:hypothetical protein BIW11_02862 [Tropilaelaps mercedesae]